MGDPARRLTAGLPRMHKEPGERRDFLPDLVAVMVTAGAHVWVESGIGSGMGLTDRDYTSVSPRVHAGDNDQAFRQDVALVLRCPDESEFDKMRPGATLISMLHFPTRPLRVQRLKELGLEAISLDSIQDDEGRRLVEDLRDVAWNGLEVAFDTLERTWPALVNPERPPVSVTIMGAGAIGKHAAEAATKYGNLERNARFASLGLRGVEVVTVGRNITDDEAYMRDRLRRSDLLVDATQRSDAGRPIVPNEWLGLLPEHAVICDLVVDPYQLQADPPTVRGIEGIPQGNLDQFVFALEDPAWERTVPPGIPNGQRRTVVSCYSWPGVHSKPCMEIYSKQLAPLLETLIQRGGIDGLRADGSFHERALLRASLRNWI